MTPVPLQPHQVQLFPSWPMPLLNAVTQSNRCELNGDDGTRAPHCPVYRQAVTSVLYLVTIDPFSLTWRGGREVEVTCPPWWQDSMNRGRANWAIRSLQMGMTKDPASFRFRQTRPLACPDCGISPLGGHLMVNFFTGLSLKTAPGVKSMVLPPVNHTHSPNWTVQQGVYDSDEFAGDFSVNLILLRQDVTVSFSAMQPVCSVLPYQPVGVPFSTAMTLSEVAHHRAAGDRHYFAKTQDGCPYPKAVEASKQEAGALPS